MVLPQKIFRVKVSMSLMPGFDVQIRLTEAVPDKSKPGEWTEEDRGIQQFKSVNAGNAVGDIIDGIMSNALDYDPVFMIYRDRQAELPVDFVAPEYQPAGRFTRTQ